MIHGNRNITQKLDSRPPPVRRRRSGSAGRARRGVLIGLGVLGLLVTPLSPPSTSQAADQAVPSQSQAQPRTHDAPDAHDAHDAQRAQGAEDGQDGQDARGAQASGEPRAAEDAGESRAAGKRTTEAKTEGGTHAESEPRAKDDHQADQRGEQSRQGARAQGQPRAAQQQGAPLVDETFTGATADPTFEAFGPACLTGAPESGARVRAPIR